MKQETQNLPVQLTVNAPATAPARLISMGSAPQPSSDFSGRIRELSGLREFFDGNIRKEATAVITGSAGQGKTRLALEFVHNESFRQNGKYDLICWIGSSRQNSYVQTSFQQSQDIRKLAGKIGIAESRNGEMKYEDLLGLVKKYVTSFRSRLFVLDNVNSLNTFNEIRPLVEGSHVLVTSLQRKLDPPSCGKRINLDDIPIDPDDGIRFLLAKSGGQDTAGARDVGTRLGWNMLLLEQARGYVSRHCCDFRYFLKLLEDKPGQVLGDRDPLASGDKKTPAELFQILIDDLKSTSPLAFKVLCLAACFAPDHVPVQLIFTQRGCVKELVARSFSNFDEFEIHCLSPSYDLSLLYPAGDGARRMHDMSAQLLRDSHARAETREMLPVAAEMIASVWRQEWEWSGSGVSGIEVLEKWPSLLVNTASIVDLLLKHKLDVQPLITSELIARLASTYELNAQFKDAENLLQQAIAWFDNNSNRFDGKARENWLDALAKLHHNRGALQTSWACELSPHHATLLQSRPEIIRHRMLAFDAHIASRKARQSAFGADDPRTLVYRHCVACAERNIGRFAESIAGASSVIAIREQQIGQLLGREVRSLANECEPGTLSRLAFDIKRTLRELAIEYGILGLAYGECSEFTKAKEWLERELNIFNGLELDNLEKGDNLEGEGFNIASASDRLADVLAALDKESHSTSHQARIEELRFRAGLILNSHPNARFVRYNCRWDVSDARDRLDADRSNLKVLVKQPSASGSTATDPRTERAGTGEGEKRNPRHHHVKPGRNSGYSETVSTKVSEFASYWWKIDSSRIDRFISQFPGRMRWLGEALIDAVEYHTPQFLNKALTSALLSLNSNGRTDMCLCLLGGGSKSGALVSGYSIDPAIKTPCRELLAALRDDHHKVIVFIDDCSLTGTQVVRIMSDYLGLGVGQRHRKNVDPLPPEAVSKLRNRHLIFVAAVGTELAFLSLRQFLEKQHISHEIVFGKSIQLLTPAGTEDLLGGSMWDDGKIVIRDPLRQLAEPLFSATSQLQRAGAWEEAKTFCEDVGYALLEERAKREGWSDQWRKVSALGYGGMQMRIVFFNNVPRPTLTLLWSDGMYRGNAWTPLFRPRD